MLVQPGKPAVPADAVDLLLECHGRISTFLALARRLGEARGAAPDAVMDAERHFAAHLAREEAVIFPAIRRLLDQAADAALVKEIRLRRVGFAERASGPAGT